MKVLELMHACIQISLGDNLPKFPMMDNLRIASYVSFASKQPHKAGIAQQVVGSSTGILKT
jgi:hypothetical protein